MKIINTAYISLVALTALCQIDIAQATLSRNRLSLQEERLALGGFMKPSQSSSKLQAPQKPKGALYFPGECEDNLSNSWDGSQSSTSSFSSYDSIASWESLADRFGMQRVKVIETNLTGLYVLEDFYSSARIVKNPLFGQPRRLLPSWTRNLPSVPSIGIDEQQTGRVGGKIRLNPNLQQTHQAQSTFKKAWGVIRKGWGLLF